jgi:GDP-L-fucose synthase
LDKHHKIFVAGHKGLVGSSIVRLLRSKGYDNLLLCDRKKVDLTSQPQVNALFEQERPDYVFLAAAKVGGIHANNTYRGEFIYDNLMIECNIIEAARQHDVKRLLFLGSSCIYPRNCSQPMKELDLLTGELERTNEPYAIAKIAGLKLCEAYNDQYGTSFASVMPTNLYGPNDNFDLNNSHVLPALLRKFHEAKEESASNVTVWGSGSPKREFLYVDDMAEACYFVMQQNDFTGVVNVGSGQEISIHELATLIKEVTQFQGELVFDSSKPDGTPRKLLDISQLSQMGWQAKTQLHEGIQQAYNWYLKQTALTER